MTDIAAVLLSILFSWYFCVRADSQIYRKGYVPIGTIAIFTYTTTYGLGWFLWRFNPDSLFGYSSQSTLSALHGMGLSFSLGMLTVSSVYCLVMSVLRSNQTLNYPPHFIYSANSDRLVSYIVIVVTLSAFLLPLLDQAGMFSRQVTDTIHDISLNSIIVPLVKATTLYSRLLPIALILLPAAFNKRSAAFKLIVISSLTAFVFMVYSTGSRTLLFTVPVYLSIGYLFWQRPKLSKVFIVTGLLLVLSVPVAEHVRVQREGDPAIADLSKKYQFFQIGKQLIGTSHDFYLYLDSKSCQADLSHLLATDPLTRQISVTGARSFPSYSFQRWHISGRLSACANRTLDLRRWNSLGQFPAGLLPKTLGFSGPSLFDGQDLSYRLSDTLDLKPGEISNSTLSLFADSWWRYRWIGVIIAFSVLGFLLAIIQTFIDYHITNGTVTGLLSQLLLFTLLGSWINNTASTTLWLLFWELPKTLFCCYLLVVLSGFVRRKHRNP